ETLPLDEGARARKQLDRRANFADVLPRPGLDADQTHLEVGRARDEHRRPRVLDLLDGAIALVRLGERFGAREQRLDAAALVGRDAVLEKVRADPESLRQPLHRLARRARLAALDLAHVLLAETRAREVGLRQAGRNAQLANAVTKARCACGS